ncbi:hypothetical protein O9H85_25945 [Paenibacillus filicis]|uniref:BclA C-terminal domain-containing protein n=1 Tax=Paenibacillus gyeongsangnamensis TaxID=3388067 RepID=A0ABT4QG11_9BACL|nr:hypothetical protein [Paenibacillus filicis]MCZ8515792.1 hypothetical protein [Paenibacillus filicis]
MGRFLDLRVSENSNTFGSPGTVITTVPALFGVIGLQTQGVAGTGTNGLIVNLTGTVGVNVSAETTTTVFLIYKGVPLYSAAAPSSIQLSM